METNLSLIKALAKTLLTEIDSLNNNNEIFTKESPFALEEKVRDFEVKLIRAALIKTAGNQRRAAQLLGVKPTTLNNKIKAYNINCLEVILNCKSQDVI